MGLMKGGGRSGGGGGGGGGGEIVQVQGGHIVRATGRKDRHSKVYTAKGPRDRRVRLSAHTAIQFYDVQDRLGFDRPSKAVDWLINKAKSSIDKLAELPPWEPMAASSLAAAPPPPRPSEVSLQANSIVNSTKELAMAAVGEERGSESPDDGYQFPIHREPGLDSRSTAVPCASSLFHSQLDTTPFFTTSSAMAASSSINFNDYCSSNFQDLGLSLHPFQAPNFVRQHGDHINQTAIFPMMAADYPRYMFNPSPLLTQPLFLGQTQSSAGFLQRGTLQSSFTPSFRSYEEIQPNDSSSSAHYQHSLLGSRFQPEGSLPGFCIQSQMQQVDEHGSTVSGRPTLSSSSPSSCR